MMMNISNKIFRHKNEVRGRYVWVILFCDNFKAHLEKDVRRVFYDSKFLLLWFTPNMTDFIQSIDEVIRRSVRTAISHFLGSWLMEE